MRQYRVTDDADLDETHTAQSLIQESGVDMDDDEFDNVIALDVGEVVELDEGKFKITRVE